MTEKLTKTGKKPSQAKSKLKLNIEFDSDGGLQIKWVLNEINELQASSICQNFGSVWQNLDTHLISSLQKRLVSAEDIKARFFRTLIMIINQLEIENDDEYTEMVHPGEVLRGLNNGNRNFPN